MAFLNALGRVSRQGQWRFRHVFRAADPTGRLDLSDAGLIDFSRASELALTMIPRRPFAENLCASIGACHELSPALSARLSDRTLTVINPGYVEALFPAGWSDHIPPGLYDLRIMVTIGPETAFLLDEPVELV